jgi:two-component system sensor histidine kinase YesM
VVVEAREESGRLNISVTDNGPGFTAAEDVAREMPGRTRGGYGLVNIRQRLDGYFGSEATLSVERANGLTVVTVALPLLRQEPRTPLARDVAR